MTETKGRIAIVGGGIGGLMSAYLLDKAYDVTLFEKESRLGGNAYTLETHDGEVIDVSVFAFSKSGYPNFFKLLSELRIAEASIPLTTLGTSFHNLDTKKTDVFVPLTMNPRWAIPSIVHALKMRSAVLKGIELLDEGKLQGLTTEEALKLIPAFKGKVYMRTVFAICLAASMYFDEVLRSPASFFFGKLKSFFMKLDFCLMRDKTGSYVDAIARSISGEIALNSKIAGVERGEDDVTVHTQDGASRSFDKIVFACNADQVLELLENPTSEEERLLGPWRYKDGLVVVHRDHSSFPKRSLQRMYDYLYTCRNGKYCTSINASYRFQHGVSRQSEYLGTQHPNFPIDEKLVEFKKVFRTPIYEAASFAAVNELPSLNGKMNSCFCGSHFGFGLHEDAVRSAVEVARHLGVEWG